MNRLGNGVGDLAGRRGGGGGGDIKAFLPFRGKLRDVRAAQNNPEGIWEMAGLGWEAKKVRLRMVLEGAEEGAGAGAGAGERYAPWPQGGEAQKFGIIKNQAPWPAIDGGLACGREFQLLDNREVIGDMARSAQEWGLVISHAGELGGGEWVLAYAGSPKLVDIAGVDKGYATHWGDLGKGAGQDPVEAGILMVASHRPGVKSRWIPKVVRFVCTNGVVIGVSLAGYRVGHRARKGEGYQAQRVDGVFEQFNRDFGEWCGMAQGFAGVDLPEVAQRAYLAEVMDPELWERILRATQIRGRQDGGVDIPRPPSIGLDELLVASGEEPNQDTPERLARVEVVEGLLGRDQSRRIVEELLEGLAGRSLGQVEEVMRVGPGQAGLGGLARPYHALTHWVDHQRGRKGGDTAVVSQEWGQGAEMKFRAGQVGKDWMRDLAKAGQAGR